MIFGKTKLELKVGVFVFIGIVLLSFSVLSIGKVKHWTSGYKVKFGFNFVNGVKMGAPVRFAGVDQGEVKSIKLVFFPQEQKTRAYVECWIKNGISIPIDSTIWVNTLGLLGEKYIEIIPGKDQAMLLDEGASLVGEDPISFEEISSMIGKLSIKLQDSVDGFNKVIQNPKNQQSVEELLENLKLITKNIQEGKGTVGKLLYDDSIFEDLESFTADLKANPWKLLYRPSRRELKSQ